MPEDRPRRRRRPVAIGVAIAAVAAVVIAVVLAWPGREPVRAAHEAPARVEPSSTVRPPVRPPSDPDLPVAGWVIDGGGLPIADVEIRVRDDAGAETIVTSEADGAFRFAPVSGARTLLLDAPHVFPAEVRWQGDRPPPRILLTRRMQLDARVTRDGAPVAGAEVHLSDGSSPTLETALTDADGVARFDDLLPGPYEVWARDGRMASPLVRTVHETEPHAEIDLALAPAGTVRGRVAADGALPPGTAALLVPVDVDHAVRVATLDPAGTFTIEGVPPGRWRVDASAPGYFRDDDREVEVDEGAVDVEVRLRRAGVVTGTVVDARGSPVRNATLVLRAQGAAARASLAEIAAVEQRAAQPAARLRWVHPLAGERQMPGRDSRRFGAARAGARPAECGRGHCGVDLGGTRGVVVHAAADGVVALVYTEIRREAGRYVAIDHAGGLRSFYMHLEDIRPDLEIGQPIRAGEPIGTVGRTGVIKDAPHLHFSIAQERGTRTWYLDPEPILQHAVVLPVARPFAPAAPGTGPTVIASVRWAELGIAPPPAAAPPPRFTTDERGRFRLDGVTPGEYVAAAFHADLAPGASDPFAVRAGEETGGVVIELTPGVIVHGRVIGPRGVIHGARVVAEEGFGETSHKVATAFTDADGEFELRSLSGSLTLNVSAPGHGDVERAVRLDRGDERRGSRREDFDLDLEDARVLGDVLGPDGHPVAGAVVRIVDGPTLRRRATTDAQGHFTIAPLARGTYVVELSHPDFPATRATFDSDRWKEVRLVLGGSLAAQVRDAHTAANLAGVRVEASGPDDRIARGVTGPDGIATLRGLPPGRWTLRARARGYVAAEESVEVRAAKAPAEVRLELRRGAVLAGVVRDRYGRRVAGARVWVGDASTRTDADGNFRLVDVPTGKVELEAELDAARATLPLELAPGDEQVTLKVDLAGE